MNMKRKILYIALFALLLCSCDENNGFNFNGGSQVYINSNDSTSFSFAVKPQEYIVHQIKIPLKITGLSTSVDREIPIRIDESRTVFAVKGDALAGGHYEIEKCFIPKDSVNSYVVINLYRNNINTTLESLNKKNEDMAIAFTILESENFGGNLGKNKLKYIITFNDRLSIPKNWGSIQTYFGAPSLVKYKFMIDVLGISEFPTSGDNKYDPGEFIFFKDKLKTALVKYNKEHKDPLKDENENLVSFG